MNMITDKQANAHTDLSHELLIRIQSIYGNLRKAEKKAIDSILKHPEIFKKSTISEMAEFAGCSDATLVRLAKRLGFSGYLQLRRYELESNSDRHVPYQEISDNDSTIEVVDKVFKSIKQSLSDTTTLFDKRMYEQAIKFLLDANSILFIGNGDAYTVAYSAYLKFSKLGYSVNSSNDFDIQMIETAKLTKSDVLFVITHSGETDTIFKVCTFAKSQNVRIIVITNFPLSPIAKLADALLLTADFTESMHKENMAKRILELSILEALYVNVLIRIDENKKDILKRTIDASAFNKL